MRECAAKIDKYGCKINLKRGIPMVNIATQANAQNKIMKTYAPTRDVPKILKMPGK